MRLSSIFCSVALLVGLTSCRDSAPVSTAASSAMQVNLSPSEISLEKEGVRSAILDYVEGIYEVDSSRIRRSVHPELRKRGYWYNKKESAYRDNLDMTFAELMALAASWNQSGKRADDGSPKVIEIYDVNDRTASAKLTAEWGIDYFHLAKIDGKWMIMNVLWQSIKEEDPTAKG